MHKNINLTYIDIDNWTRKLVMTVFDSGHLVQGPMVEELESQFVKITGSNFAVAVSSGTAALHTALAALKLQPGDQVITSPFTFIASANSILMAGGTPVFVDIDPATYNLDTNLVEPAITKKTKAILAINLYGHPANYRVINQIAKNYGLVVIEDAAQSVGATHHGKQSGNLADISCFSLYATKNLMSGEGGVITTNSNKYYQFAKQFRHHGQDQSQRYTYHQLGYNYRMTDITAAIALGQLRTLKKNTVIRRRHARNYTKSFKSVRGIIPPVESHGNTHVYHQYTIRVSEDYPLTRDQLKNHLADNGVQSNIYYPIPLHQTPHLKKVAKIPQTGLPHTKLATQQVLSIPVHSHLR